MGLLHKRHQKGRPRSVPALHSFPLSTNHPFFFFPLPLYNCLSLPSFSFPPLSLLLYGFVSKKKEEEEEKGWIGMLLGKRPRPPMRRTTSMSEFTFDVVPTEPPAQPTHDQAGFFHADRQHPGGAPEGCLYYPRLFPGVASPRNRWRNSDGFVETAHFLRACGFCRRRLATGIDIYMYRYMFYVSFWSLFFFTY